MGIDAAQGDFCGFIPFCAFGFDLPSMQDIGQMLEFLVRNLIYGPVFNPEITDPLGKSGREAFRQDCFDSGLGPEDLLFSEMLIEIEARKKVDDQGIA